MTRPCSDLWLGTWPLSGPTWNLDMSIGWAPIDEADRRAVIERAVAAGIAGIDTADVYGTGKVERSIGAVLDGASSTTVQIATKVGYFAGTAATPWRLSNLQHQLQTSLVNLRRRSVDLLTLHNNDFVRDPAALDAVQHFAAWARDGGLIDALGVRGPHASHVAAPRPARGLSKYEEFELACSALAPEVVTIRLNALTPMGSPAVSDMLRRLRASPVQVRVSKPLGQGLLLPIASSTATWPMHAGDQRSRRRWFQPNLRAEFDRELQMLLGRLGRDACDATAVMLAFVRQHVPGCQPIVGLRSVEQVDTAFASPNLMLTIDELEQVSAWARRVLASIGSRDALAGPKGATA